LLIIGQNEIVASTASKFCKAMLPSVFFALQYNTSIRYLQSMNIYFPGMVVSMITASMHSLWCIIFIYFLDLGVRGAAFAMELHNS